MEPGAPAAGDPAPQSAIERYCAKWFNGCVAITPRRVLTSPAVQSALEAAMTREQRDSEYARIVTQVGIDPRKVEELVFFLNLETAHNIAGGQPNVSPLAKRKALEKIGLAFMDFHDQFNSFPDDDGHPRTSKGRLSWRVHLLPFLGEEELYREFRLDEPWSSPHNKALITRMPACFKSAGIETPPGKTTIHVMVGPGAPFAGDKGPRISDFLDGMSATILAIVGGPNTAETWTRPGGLTHDPRNPRAVFGDITDAPLVLRADTSARFLPEGLNPVLLTSLIQSADRRYLGGGEVLKRPHGRPAVLLRTSEDLTGEERLGLTRAVCGDLFPGDPGRDTLRQINAAYSRPRTANFQGHRIAVFDYPIATSGKYGVCFPDARTMVAAPLHQIMPMLGNKVASVLGRELTRRLETDDLVVSLDHRVLSPLTKHVHRLDADLGDFRGARLLTLRGGLSRRPALADLSITADSPNAASRVSKTLTRWLGGLIESEDVALSNPLTRMVARLASDKVRTEGAVVTLSLDAPTDSAGLLSLLKTPVRDQYAHVLASRAREIEDAALGKIYKVADGFDRTVDAYAQYPGSNRFTDRQGFSWRVHILPVLGHYELFKKFRFNEAWDSDHNRALIKEMPDLFKTAGVSTPGHTAIHILRGPGTTFGDGSKKVDRSTLKDSEALLLVVAGPDKAAPWTRPGGLDFDPAKPRACLGNATWPLTAALFDTRVVKLKETVSDETLRRLVNPGDGKPLDFKDIEVRKSPSGRNLGSDVPDLDPDYKIDPGR